jgi:hypothetical protein
MCQHLWLKQKRKGINLKKLNKIRVNPYLITLMEDAMGNLLTRTEYDLVMKKVTANEH